RVAGRIRPDLFRHLFRGSAGCGRPVGGRSGGSASRARPGAGGDSRSGACESAEHGGGGRTPSARHPFADSLSARDPRRLLASPATGPDPWPPWTRGPGARPPAARCAPAAEIDKMIAAPPPGIRRGARPRPAAPAPPARPAVQPVLARPAETGVSVSSSGPDHFGQYEILERIASGGMAELYRARRSGVEGFQKIVAIKKILPHLADNEEFITM